MFDFAARGLLKSNTHDILLVVNFSPVSYRRDHDRSLILVEDHTPVTNAKSHAIAPLEALHIAMPGGRKLRQAPVNPTTPVRR